MGQGKKIPKAKNKNGGKYEDQESGEVDFIVIHSC